MQSRLERQHTTATRASHERAANLADIDPNNDWDVTPGRKQVDAYQTHLASLEYMLSLWSRGVALPPAVEARGG